MATGVHTNPAGAQSSEARMYRMELGNAARSNSARHFRDANMDLEAKRIHVPGDRSNEKRVSNGSLA